MCDNDVMTLIGEQVEIRRKMNKVMSHLNQVGEWDGKDGMTFYDYYCDEYWWMDMRFCQFVETPEWLEECNKGEGGVGFGDRNSTRIDVFQ
jgi:hypothetical protein